MVDGKDQSTTTTLVLNAIYTSKGYCGHLRKKILLYFQMPKPYR